jgi:hypothetical protein
MQLINKTSFFFQILFFSVLPNALYGQSNQLDMKLCAPIGQTLSNYSIGSGFSFVVFKKQKKNTIEIIQIVSSNTITKHLLDSLFSLPGIEVYFSKLKKGNYCLPIIQNMYTSDIVLIWPNNTSSNIALFDRHLILPENAMMLRPYVIHLEGPVK